MINTQITTFENQLLDFVNGVPLPLALKKTVVENLYLKLTLATNEAVKAELEEAKHEEENKEDDPGNEH